MRIENCGIEYRQQMSFIYSMKSSGPIIKMDPWGTSQLSLDVDSDLHETIRFFISVLLCFVFQLSFKNLFSLRLIGSAMFDVIFNLVKRVRLP